MAPRVQRFATLLRSQVRADRLALSRELSASPMAEGAASLLGSDDPAQHIVTAGILVTSLAFGQDAQAGGDLAIAAYPYALEVFRRQPAGGPLDLTTVSGIASAGLHALNLVGRYSEAVVLADRAADDLAALGEHENLPDVRAHRIEALLGLDRIDEARRRLDEAEREPIRSVHLARLRKQIEVLVQRAETPRPEEPTSPAVSTAEFETLRGAFDRGAQVLTRGSHELNEWTASQVHLRVGSLIQDPRDGRDPGRLAAALGELGRIEEWAQRTGHGNVHNDTLWEIYLCHSRRNEHSEAADALQRLRRNVEKQRAGIAAPRERAGVGSKYPYLYPALAQMLRRAGRHRELLGAIEGAKGRAVADVMAAYAGTLIDEGEFAEPAERLSPLLGRAQAHYLSFLVDDDDTLAVLVARDGSLHTSPSIPLGKASVRAASRGADPRAWGQPDPADPTGPPVAALDEVLAPLVGWLEPLLELGVLREGDHLCFSPDEHLHQIPLAYVRFRGAPVCRTFSLSRVHGARALTLLLARAAVRPSGYTAIEVPAMQDAKKRVMVGRMRAAGDWLGQHLAGTVLRDEAATLRAVGAAGLSGRVVHFATHGVFPAEEAAEVRNPFTHSGVALAGRGGLPDTAVLARGEAPDSLLTPERLLAKRLDFDGSHITLQACLSGLAREGIGGDALGLEWACFQQGAASLLASHWNVSADLSAEFFVRFYSAWLERGHTRATAWRETVLGMMGEAGPLGTPYAWAAFSLSGDWR